MRDRYWWPQYFNVIYSFILVSWPAKINLTLAFYCRNFDEQITANFNLST